MRIKIPGWAKYRGRRKLDLAETHHAKVASQRRGEQRANVRRGLAVIRRGCHLRWGGPPEKRRNAMLPYTFHGARAARYISLHQYASTVRHAVVNTWPKDIEARYYDANERIQTQRNPR